MEMQKTLTFVEKGEDFLEYKREQLIYEIKSLWTDYKEKRRRFFKIAKKAFIKLNQNYKEMNKKEVMMVSKTSKLQFEPILNLNFMKKVGIIVPQINYELRQEERLPSYSFGTTSHYLDELIDILKLFFEELILLAETEDVLLKFAFSFRKINRRIHALKDNRIPKLKSDIQKVEGILEELERESFVRLKKTKELIEKKK